MKKKALVLMMIMFFVFMPRVEAICNLKYDEYTEENIEHAYVIGEYVFNLDTGYSPSLEDIAHAARTIPEGKEEYIYDIYNISDLNGEYEYEKWEVLDSEFDGNKKNLSIDVSYEYWANIRGATEDEYDLFYCQVGSDTLDVIYTTLDTVGESEYKTEATRTAQITSTNKISKVEYCITTASECTPDTEATLESDNTIKISYDTNIAGQKVCVKAYDEIGNYTDIICDNQYVLVDKESAILEATEVLGTVIEKEPNGLEELFDITYSVSGGEVDYFYYIEENGIKEKYLLTDLSDLPEGEIEVEAKVISGNGLVTTETRVITVVKHVVTYDYKTNGGTSSDITEYKASYKGKAKLSEVAYKEGYEFIGWNLDPNATTGLDTLVVEEDTTLYAIYKGNIGAEFIVKTKDGSIPATTEYETVECEVYNNVDRCNVTIPMLNAKVGYEAIGWSKTEYNKTAEYVGGETIEIKSKEKYYSVTRDKTGKTVTYNSYRDGEIIQDLIKCYPYNGETSCTVDPSGITSDEYNGREFIKYVDEEGNPVPDGEYDITSGKEYYAYYEDIYEITYKSGIDKEEKDEASVRFVVKDTGIEETVEELIVKEPEEIEGWEFTGYRKDAEYGESQLNPGEKIKITGDVTYSAMYRKPIKVTYELDTGVTGAPENETGYGYYLSATNEQIDYTFKLAEIEDMSWTGNLFEKWIVNGEEYDPGEEITIDSDTTVTAKWSVDGCIVYFDYATNGGSSASKTSITYINGDPSIDLSGITAYKTGWEFIGWTDKKGATTNALEVYRPEDTTTGDKTLYAMFKKTIRVDFRIQDGNQRFNLPTNERQEFTIYNAETEAIVTMPEVDELNNNYEFLGWTKEENGEKVEYEAGQTAKVSNYTIFYTVTKTKQPITSSYHYYDENGNGAVDEVGCYLYNGETTCETKSTVTESIYGDAVLGGWSSNATTVKLSNNQIINKDTDFYGVYDEVITVSYYSGMDKASTSISTKAKQMIVSPSGTTNVSPTIVLETPDGISGYQTLGWRTDKVGGEAELKANATYKLTDSIELYGTYLKNVTISYVTNGGSPTPANETKKMYYNTAEDSSNVKIEFTLANELTKVGYEFKGWLVNNTGNEYEAGSKIELSQNTKMYASWEVKKYKVTYNYESNGGSSVTTKEKETAYLSQVDLTPVAYKEGYEFVGWSSEENSTKVLNQLEMPAEEITLYAVYRAPVEATWILTDSAAGTLSTDKTICYKYNEAENCKVSTAQVTVSEGYIVTGWTRTQGSLTVEVSNNSQTALESKETFYSISRTSSPTVGTFYYPVNKVDEETGDALEEEEITSKEVNCYKYNGASTCKVSAPVKPTTYQSAIFDGWTHSKTEMTEVEYELTENKNYYSHFTAVTEIIYHDGKNNENIIDTNAIQYTLAEDGDNANIPAFVLRTPTEFDDYKQIGWTSISDKMTTTEEYKAGEELDGITSYELYALYQRDLTVSYDANEGPTTPADDVQVQTYHSFIGQTEHKFTVSDEVTRNGYTFVNWALNSIDGEEETPLTEITIEEHRKYYAIWDVNEYKIEYDYVNGEIGGTNPTEAEYDQTLEIENPVKIVTIVGDANRTGAEVPTMMTKESVFAGWSLVGNFETAEYAIEENNLIRWTDNTILPKANYVKNLETEDGGVAKLTATYEPIEIILPSIEKEGFTCTWNTESDGSGTTYEPGDAYTIPGDTETEVRFYGQCDAHSYTIIYNKNNASATGTMANQKVYYGKQVVLTNNEYTLDGYQILGWATETNGEVVYQNMDFVKNLTPVNGAVINLYAVWTPAIDLNELKYMEKPDHTHIWTNKYTDTEHWQECTVCGIEKDSSRTAHNMEGNNGSKYLVYDVGGTAYKESCACGKTTGPQVIIYGDPEQYTEDAYVANTYLYMSQIKQITYNEYVANDYTNNCELVGATYKWHDYDGDGYGHVFASTLILSSGTGQTGTIKWILGSEGDYGNKEAGAEYYALVVYVNGDSTPTRSEFVTWLTNKINSSANPTNHGLYGYHTKYANATDAQFNKITALIRQGNTILTSYHTPAWGCQSGHLIREGAQGITGSSSGHYGGHTHHYDSNIKSTVDWYGPAGTCDICGLYFDGLADTYHNWHICSGGNNKNLRTTPGATHTCGGHSVTLNGKLVGTVYCNYRNDNGTIKGDWTVVPADGWTYTETVTSEYTITTYDASSENRYSYPNYITFSNGTTSKSRYAGFYYILNDNSIPTPYGYSNETTTTSYWEVINNGTKDNPSNQPQLKVTFKDLAQFSSNTVKVRLLDSDKSTVIKQGNGNEWVPLSIISGANGTDGSEVLWQTTLNVPTEVDGSKLVYVQAMDATGYTSEMIPMQISYVDNSGPKINLSLDTNAWSQYKTLTVTVEDIHDVYLGVFKDDMINVSTSEYNNKRVYVFNGDMYETNYVTVYALDSLGNLSYKTIQISDIDSATPNINKVNINGLTITIEADDLNATMNVVGSGVAKYGYINIDTEGDIIWTTDNVIELPEEGTYLIYVEDNAGNISDPYQIKVTE